MGASDNLQFENEVFLKLQAAELSAELSDVRFSSSDVLTAIKDAIEEEI